MERGGDVVLATNPGAAVGAKCVNPGPGTSNSGFTVCAAGNVDRDKTIDVWTMRDSKYLTNDMNDVGN